MWFGCFVGLLAMYAFSSISQWVNNSQKCECIFSDLIKLTQLLIKFVIENNRAYPVLVTVPICANCKLHNPSNIAFIKTKLLIPC